MRFQSASQPHILFATFIVFLIYFLFDFDLNKDNFINFDWQTPRAKRFTDALVSKFNVLWAFFYFQKSGYLKNLLVKNP